MSRIALGTAQFGLAYGITNQVGQVPTPEVTSMLSLAINEGIDTLDTASAYGESESRLGEIGTKGFKVITKLPHMPQNCQEIFAWVDSALTASLARLGAKDIYGLLIHNSAQLLSENGPSIYNSLQKIKQSGRVKKVGISIYSPDDLTTLMRRYRFDLVQAPFNLMDRRLHATGMLSRLKDLDIEVHTRSAFLQGLLLLPENKIPNKFAPWNSLWKKWHQWLLEYKMTPLEASLAWPLSFPEIDRVIVGAESLKQLTEIINTSNETQLDYFPELECLDSRLITPSNWTDL